MGSGGGGGVQFMRFWCKFSSACPGACGCTHLFRVQLLGRPPRRLLDAAGAAADAGFIAAGAVRALLAVAASMVLGVAAVASAAAVVLPVAAAALPDAPQTSAAAIPHAKRNDGHNRQPGRNRAKIEPPLAVSASAKQPAMLLLHRTVFGSAAVAGAASAIGTRQIGLRV